MCTGLKEFLARLDRRYDDKVKKDGVTMAKKPRKIGFDSQSLPPPDAPEWTIEKQWKGIMI